MKSLLSLLGAATALLFLTQCKPRTNSSIDDSFVRINATIQTFNAGQPWQRNTPSLRSGLGTILSPTEILTTAEMVANQTYLELESANSSQTVKAKVVAIDYTCNLALLTPIDPDKTSFLNGKTPLALGEPAQIGSNIKIWQFEANGVTVYTDGQIRAVDTIATLLPGYSFLTYIVKGSMQSATSSFTLPATHDGKLVGVLTSYDSENQTSRVIAPEIIQSFLTDARDGDYTGFPSLGCATQRTEDHSLREYLGLSNDQGGLYVSLIQKNSPADRAGLEKGDVLIQIDDKKVDRQGYITHDSYGPLSWTVLIRGNKQVGEDLSLKILRNGEPLTLTASLQKAKPDLIPYHINDSPPPFLIKGGLVFQELSRSYLQAYGENWTTRAPIALMKALENPENYEEDRNSIVFLARVIPNPATIGYDQLSGIIVNSVNGTSIKDLHDLSEAFTQTPDNGIHTIDLDEIPGTLYLDAQMANEVDGQLLKQGLSSLSRMPQQQD